MTETGRAIALENQNQLITPERQIPPRDLLLIEALRIDDPEGMYRQRVDNAVATLMARQPGPREAAAVQAVGDRLYWDIFAGVDDPLPESSALVEDVMGGDGLVVMYRPEYGISDERHTQYRTALLDEMGNVADLWRTRVETIKQNGFLDNYIRQGQAYASLAVLTSDPKKGKDEQPLTPQRVQQRRAEERQRVEHLTGLDQSRLVTSHHVARNALQRRMLPIEEERERARGGRRAGSSSDRVISWVKSVAGTLLSKRESYDVQVESVVSPKGQVPINSVLEVHISDPRIAPLTISSKRLNGWSADFAGNKSSRFAHKAVGIDNMLAGHFVKLIATNSGQGFTVDSRKVLDEAVSYNKELIASDLKDDIKKGRMMAALRRPIASVFAAEVRENLEVVDEIVTSSTADTSVGVVSYEDYRQQAEATSGSVERRAGYADGHNRVVQMVAAPSFINTGPKPYDLKITGVNSDFPGFDDAAVMPLIPGYETLGRDGDDWFFVRSPHDPYEGAEHVVIPSERVVYLRNNWDSRGLDSLVRVLDEHEQVTLADVAAIIADNSLYTFDVRQQAENASADSEDPNALPRYAGRKITAEGITLLLQCSSANKELHDALTLCLPNAGLGTAVGLMLESDAARTSSSHHAQTVVVHSGRRYILDATPSGFDDVQIGEQEADRRTRERQMRAGAGSIWQGAKEALRRVRRERSAKRAEVNDVVPAPDDDSEAETYPEMSFAEFVSQAPRLADVEKQANQGDQTEDMLRRVYGVATNDDLYAVLRGLPATDPVRQVVHALAVGKHEREGGLIDGRTAEQERATARALIEAALQRRERKGADVTAYSRDMLKGLLTLLS